MNRIFRGKRVEDMRLVEVVVGERVVLLSLKPSLQIAERAVSEWLRAVGGAQ